MTRKYAGVWLSRRAACLHLGRVGAGAGALVAAACAPGAQAPAKPASFKKKSLSAPSWWAPHEIEGAEAAFAKHFTPQTGVTVTYEPIRSNFDDAMFTRMAAGKPDDVITFNADSVPRYLDRGLLLPIDDLVKRDKFDLSDFFPVVTDQWTHEGKLYGLANDVGSYHTYVNLDLFKRAGVTPPGPTQDWTWDTLLDAARRLHKPQGDTAEVWGFVTNMARDLWPNMNGAFLFDERVTRSLADQPAVVDAYQFVQDLMHKQKVTSAPGVLTAGWTGGNGPHDLFLGSRIAILLDGTWQTGFLRSKKAQATFEWDVAMLPRGPRSSALFVPNFSAGWALPKGAEDPEASWAAMKFYASKTFAEEVMFVTLSSLPSRKSALQSGKFAQWPNNPPRGLTTQFYGKVIERGAAVRTLKFNLSQEIRNSLNKLNAIYRGERPALDVCREIAVEVNAELAKAPWVKR